VAVVVVAHEAVVAVVVVAYCKVRQQLAVDQPLLPLVYPVAEVVHRVQLAAMPADQAWPAHHFLRSAPLVAVVVVDDFPGRPQQSTHLVIFNKMVNLEVQEAEEEDIVLHQLAMQADRACPGKDSRADKVEFHQPLHHCNPIPAARGEAVV
jgi:hypothetical protein